ncbi:MAG: TerD family protein [Dactylosporangium sp.]|nr:TerD family protein [Dactylosporangium sp.]NNJ62679.1 TerD family protein [Dactylosporangium sp.]
MSPATWAKGENALLAGLRLRVSIEATVPVDLSALLLTRAGRVRSDADLVFYNQPAGQGTRCHVGGHGGPTVEVELDALGEDLDRVLIAVSLDDEASTFGAVPPQTVRLQETGGHLVGTFSLDGLGPERAVIALEFYRRAGRWKVRAVGQGYPGGLGELVTIHGVLVGAGTPEPPARQTGIPPGVPIRFTANGGHPVLPAGSPDRRYDQLWGIFEDAARSAAALASASEFARQRLERELSAVVADPATRNSPQAGSARTAAQRRYDELLAIAGANHRRDTDQLRAELAELAGILPAPLAAWDDPVWSGWVPPAGPATGLRLGTLRRAAPPGPVLPFVARLPLIQPVWIDAGGGAGAQAGAQAMGLLTRLLAAHPPGALTASIVDLEGQGAAAQRLGPLLSAGTPPIASLVTSPGQLSGLLTDLASRVDMTRMAARAGAGDALVRGAGTGPHVLVWHDFPFGLDERGLTSVHFLLEEGPAAGVWLLLVADSTDALAADSRLERIWEAALRLPATQNECIGDPWVGLVWTYAPDPVPGPTIDRALAALASAVPRC